MDEVQRKLCNKNYIIFEEQLRKLPDDVLKKLDDNPDLMEVFAKRSLDDPDFYKAVQKGDLNKLDELKQTNKGKYRADLFSAAWPKASLRENIKRFAPDAKGIKTFTGKIIYKNNKTGIQVVYDEAGKYFRIEDTKLTGNRKYLDLNGNIPNNKIVNGKQMGRTKSEYNEVHIF